MVGWARHVAVVHTLLLPLATKMRVVDPSTAKAVGLSPSMTLRTIAPVLPSSSRTRPVLAGVLVATTT
jgi:hypothetical protein